MNEHHSARRVGFAAVAAVALLAVGAWAYRQWGGSRAPKPNHLADAPLGDPSKNDDVGLPPPEQQPAPQPEEARELPGSTPFAPSPRVGTGRSRPEQQGVRPLR